VGSTGNHGSKRVFSLRKILVASGVAVAAALAATAWIVVSGSGGTSRTVSQAAPAEADLARTPAASPTAAGPTATAPATPTPSATASKKPAAKLKAKAKAKATPKKTGYKVVRSGVCEASFYGEGQETASGESFNPSELTAAHKTLPFGTKVRVTNEANGESVIVRINDRGPYAGGRCLDLSTAAMKAVGGIGAGVITAKYQVLAKN
jgi:rare lipoprotein A (peptidoglycan hydrolase)